MSGQTQKMEQIQIQESNNGLKDSITNVRINDQTNERLEELRTKTNDKPFGKKVNKGQIISLGLSLIKEDHITLLQQQSMNEDDQEEFIYNEWVKENGATSKKEFKRKMFRGDLTKFIKKLELNFD